MSKPLTLARLLLISTALCPALAIPAADAQDGGAVTTGAPDVPVATPSGAPTAAEQQAAETGNVDVSIPGADKDKVQALVEDAHTVCPYSKATRGSMPVKLSVV